METVLFRDYCAHRGVELLGRYYQEDDVLFFAFSGSGLKFRFHGTSFKLDYHATNSDDPVARPYIAIKVDGQFKDRIGLYKEVGCIEISNLNNSSHVIEIIKATEGQISQFGVKKLEIAGFFEEIEHKNVLKIEIYGDSITAGYAVLSDDKDTMFFSKDEDYCSSYAYLLNNHIPCEVSSICAGGFPIYKSIYTSGYLVDNIPDLISKAGFKYGQRLEDCPSWDNKLFHPDIVIINLGGNDSSVGEEHFNKVAFSNKLVSFFDNLYFLYGDKTKIIFMSGMMEFPSFVMNTIDEVISKYKRKIYRFKTDSLSVGGIMPGEGHPNKEMHKFAAKQLSEYIKEVVEL